LPILHHPAHLTAHASHPAPPLVNDINVTLMSWDGLLQNPGVSGCGVCPGLTGSVHGEELPSC